MIDTVSVGRFIAQRRKALGMTQARLAERLQVTDKAISKWERGLNYPDLTLLEPLAAALETTVPLLLGLAADTQPDPELVGALAAVSDHEKEQMKSAARVRAVIVVVIGLIFFVADLWASNIFADNGFFGLPQVLTMGKCGLTGFLIGNGLWTLKMNKKL